MKPQHHWIFAAVAAFLCITPTLASAAAPNWQSPPVACLPERATPKPGADCACPPASKCPSNQGVTSLDQWYKNSQMGSDLTYQCCTAPLCPAGTELAGQPMPRDGVCGTTKTTEQEECIKRNSTDPNACNVRRVWGCVEYFWQEAVDCPFGSDGETCFESPAQCSTRVGFNPPPGSCLSADSLVTKADGSTIALREVKIGDLLKGPQGQAEVTVTNHYNDKRSQFYRINGFKFTVTGNHPVKTTTGWKVVESRPGDPTPLLALGDTLETANGPVEVKSIASDPTENGNTSVNISTLGDKPFYVDGVAVKSFKAIAFTY